MSEQSYPFAGSPRDFTAAAMPKGDRRNGIGRPMVMLIERADGEITRERYYSPDEAEHLAAALLRATRALEAGNEWNRQLGKPALRRHRLIDPSHRSMAEVMAEEAPPAPPPLPPAASSEAETPAEEPLRADVQRKCRLCGQWRVSRCSYKTCPMPETAG